MLINHVIYNIRVIPSDRPSSKRKVKFKKVNIIDITYMISELDRQASWTPDHPVPTLYPANSTTTAQTGSNQ
ncbi:Cytochrome P450 monooxygenase aclL [Fusarium oxysporum f. sp. albedinis]|nr:Cytochrome P450 monooxygenase aclL [Fusarium oxysporum f. sp. albedinis]